jgi:hypothetical protein
MRRWHLVALAFLLAGCISGGQQSLRDGLLRPDIGQKAFRTEWGLPDEVIPVLSEATVSQRWGQTVDLLRNADPMTTRSCGSIAGTRRSCSSSTATSWRGRPHSLGTSCVPSPDGRLSPDGSPYAPRADSRQSSCRGLAGTRTRKVGAK